MLEEVFMDDMRDGKGVDIDPETVTAAEIIRKYGSHNNWTGDPFVPASNARKVAAETGLLTSTDVVKLSGLTYRQLDYWCSVERITPLVGGEGSGSARLFRPSVVGEIKRVQALRSSRALSGVDDDTEVAFTFDSWQSSYTVLVRGGEKGRSKGSVDLLSGAIFRGYFPLLGPENDPSEFEANAQKVENRQTVMVVSCDRSQAISNIVQAFSLALELCDKYQVKVPIWHRIRDDLALFERLYAKNGRLLPL